MCRTQVERKKAAKKLLLEKQQLELITQKELGKSEYFISVLVLPCGIIFRMNFYTRG